MDFRSQNLEELLRWCVSMTRDRFTAEDLVQETLLRALQNSDTIENLSERQRGAWLRKTAKNIFIDTLRKSSRLTDAPDDLAAPDDDHSGAEIYEFLASLPPDEKTAFTLRYIDGYNSREIGEMLNIPSSTVRSRLLSAKNKYKIYLKGE